jgi:hypothetical protein
MGSLFLGNGMDSPQWDRFVFKQVTNFRNKKKAKTEEVVELESRRLRLNTKMYERQVHPMQTKL